MDIRTLTDSYSVSPQIAPQDAARIRALGFRTVIDNRPDAEIPRDQHAETMRVAMEVEGLAFIVNPVIGGAMTMDNVAVQRSAIAAAEGPVLAYCASGNRSSVVWALAMAGQMPTEELISIPLRHGYQLQAVRAQIDMLARND